MQKNISKIDLRCLIYLDKKFLNIMVIISVKTETSAIVPPGALLA